MGEPKCLGDILLIEDNPGDVRLTEEMLNEGELEFTLHIVDNVSDSLDFLHQRGAYADAPRPDIVLLDWHFPGTIGEDVLVEVRENPDLADIPVIVQSGTEPEVNSLRSRTCQADAYAVKPVEADHLVDVACSREDDQQYPS